MHCEIDLMRIDIDGRRRRLMRASRKYRGHERYKAQLNASPFHHNHHHHHPALPSLSSSIMRYSPMLAFAATALAAPFTGPSLCPTGLFSNPQCCATDVLGVVGLNCAVRTCRTTPDGQHLLTASLQLRPPQATSTTSSASVLPAASRRNAA